MHNRMKMAYKKLTTAKLREIKKRAAAIEYGSTFVDQYGNIEEVKSDFDKRIIRGYAIIWGQKNLHGEIFVKGCCAKSIREHGPDSNAPYKIKFLNDHDDAEALSLFSILKETDTGLYFETVPLDDVQWADDAIVQLRSGTKNNFSHGWNYVWDRIEFDDVNDAIVLLEISLLEISVVSIPSGMETYCMRSIGNEEDIYDQTESFILQLPKKDRLQARHLFALHRSFSDTRPLSHGNAPGTDEKKDDEKGLNIEYLINNLKL